MSLTTRSLYVLLCASMGACSSVGGAPGGGVSAAMAGWTGHRASEAVGMWGMPDSIGREGTLAVLQWRADNSVKSWMQPIAKSGSAQTEGQAWPTRCNRVLSVDAEEIIRQARWFGSGCSTDPADYAAP